MLLTQTPNIPWKTSTGPSFFLRSLGPPFLLNYNHGRQSHDLINMCAQQKNLLDSGAFLHSCIYGVNSSLSRTRYIEFISLRRNQSRLFVLGVAFLSDHELPSAQQADVFGRSAAPFQSVDVLDVLLLYETIRQRWSLRGAWRGAGRIAFAARTVLLYCSKHIGLLTT